MDDYDFVTTDDKLMISERIQYEHAVRNVGLLLHDSLPVTSIDLKDDFRGDKIDYCANATTIAEQSVTKRINRRHI